MLLMFLIEEPSLLNIGFGSGLTDFIKVLHPLKLENGHCMEFMLLKEMQCNVVKRYVSKDKVLSKSF